MTNHQIELYKQIVSKIEDTKLFDGRGKTNCYTCQKCGKVIKCRDIDKGTTPFMITCEKCQNMMHSSFYMDDIYINVEVSHEWYRPSLEEFVKMEIQSEIQHVLNGGLLLRKIE